MQQIELQVNIVAFMQQTPYLRYTLSTVHRASKSPSFAQTQIALGKLMHDGVVRYCNINRCITLSGIAPK